jgi:hypothetical protein
VYLAVGSPDSPEDMARLEESSRHAQALGYVSVTTLDIGCDRGAPEALGVDSSNFAVAVYFRTAEHAQQFVGVYDREDVGSALVTTYCRD